MSAVDVAAGRAALRKLIDAETACDPDIVRDQAWCVWHGLFGRLPADVPDVSQRLIALDFLDDLRYGADPYFPEAAHSRTVQRWAKACADTDAV